MRSALPNKHTPERFVCPPVRRQVADAGLAHLTQLPAALQHLALHLRFTQVLGRVALRCSGASLSSPQMDIGLESR